MTVLVADDHPIYIEGLVNLLQSYDFIVAGTAQNGAEAVRLAREKKPDVVLMDANMPVIDGIEATRQITQKNPEIKVVILTGVEDDMLLQKAIEAGASGFLLKRLDGDSLYRNLLELQAGNNPFSPGLEETLIRRITGTDSGSGTAAACPFTGEQLHLLELLSAGLTKQEAAEQLGKSELDIKKSIRDMRVSCGAETQSDLLAYYRSLKVQEN